MNNVTPRPMRRALTGVAGSDGGGPWFVPESYQVCRAVLIRRFVRHYSTRCSSSHSGFGLLRLGFAAFWNSRVSPSAATLEMRREHLRRPGRAAPQFQSPKRKHKRVRKPSHSIALPNLLLFTCNRSSIGQRLHSVCPQRANCAEYGCRRQ